METINYDFKNKEFDKSVIELIRAYERGEYTKFFYLRTNTKTYYTEDGFKSKDRAEIAKHNGVDTKELIEVESGRGYRYAFFQILMFEPDNKYFYRILMSIGCMAKPENSCWTQRDRLSLRYEGIQKIFPDKKTITFYPSYYDGRGEGLLKFKIWADDTTETAKIEERGTHCLWNANYGNDIKNKSVYLPTLANRSYCTMHKETTQMIKDFFVINGYEEGPVVEDATRTIAIFQKFMKEKPSMERKKTSRTKFIDDEIRPLTDAIRKFIYKLPTVKSEQYLKYWDENVKNGLIISIKANMDRPRPFIVRHDKWLIFLNGNNTAIFYNVEKKTKYMLFSNNLGHDCQWQNINERIGVLNLENFEAFKNIYMGIYERNDGNWYNHRKFFPTDDFEYEDTAKMYNINGKEISYEECFKGTNIIQIIESAKNEIFDKAINEYTTDINKGSQTYEEMHDMCKKVDREKLRLCNLLKESRVPKTFFLLLCIKEKYRLAGEQLIKSGYTNIFTLLTTDQNSFKNKEEDSCGAYESFIDFNKKGTNLKNCFKFSAAQLKGLDEWLGEYGLKINECRYRDRFAVLELPKMILGEEKVKSIDKESFKQLLIYFSKYNINKFHIERLTGLIDTFNLRGAFGSVKNTIITLEKIGNIDRWLDYLRMVEQAKELSKVCDIGIDVDKKYKTIPDKSTRFMALRTIPRTSTFYNNERTVEMQLNELKGKYKNCTEITNDENKVIGVTLSMDIPETINFLHDELQTIITVFKNEKKDILFKAAVKRVQKYVWEDDKIMIVAPTKTADIINEATNLQHCVSSFIDPIINGTENVMFIRRKDMPECPWFTMAISNSGVVEQIHCYGNGGLSKEEQKRAYNNSNLPSYGNTIDIMPSLKKWAKEKGVALSSIRENYGALCARR